MDIVTIIKIIAVILQLIASGLSESEAITGTSAKFGVAESLIKGLCRYKLLLDIY